MSDRSDAWQSTTERFLNEATNALGYQKERESTCETTERSEEHEENSEYREFLKRYDHLRRPVRTRRVNSLLVADLETSN